MSNGLAYRLVRCSINCKARLLSFVLSLVLAIMLSTVFAMINCGVECCVVHDAGMQLKHLDAAASSLMNMTHDESPAQLGMISALV